MEFATRAGLDRPPFTHFAAGPDCMEQRHQAVLFLAAKLLAAAYLGWFLEAGFFQWASDYHMVPPIMLAIVLLTPVWSCCGVLPSGDCW